VLALALAIQIVVHARSVQPGELVVLDITLPEARTAVRVRAFDRQVPSFALSPTEWQALVGIDLDRKPGEYHIAIDAGTGLTADERIVVAPKKFPTRRLSVDENFVNPPASVEARIARDSELLASVYAHSSPAREWTAAFVRPVPQPANSRFGTRSIFNGQPRNPHGGADFLSPAGTPVHAPNAGRIVVARDLYFSGNTVIIDHGQGLFSMIAHLSVIAVHGGDRVAAGDLLGNVGATGRVTGPHLHWAVRVADARVDPLSLLELLGAHH
jgi:murein DD-endopeptidase MepM/ murein hydrolase activator NlpD